MKPAIIFHSYSGITRGVAAKVHAACGGDLIEVTPKSGYSTLTAYTAGCIRARNEECDPVEPHRIDVASSDLLVIGTPVWAWKASPVINGAVAALENCSGKKAVIFATCGGKPGETLPILKRKLAEKGVAVVEEIVFNKKETEDPAKIEALISSVKKAAPAS